MSNMNPRSVTTPTMKTRVSTDPGIYNFHYNEPGVKYNQPLVTYNFYTYRGELGPRVVESANMKGR